MWQKNKENTISLPDSELRSKQTAIDTAQANIISLNNQIRLLQARKDELANDVNITFNEKKSIIDKLNKDAIELSKLATDKMGQAETKKSEAEGLFESARFAIQQANDYKAKTQADLDEKGANLYELDKQLRKLSEKLGSDQSDIETARKELADRETEITDKENRIQKKISETAEAIQKNNEIAKDFQSQQDAINLDRFKADEYAKSILKVETQMKDSIAKYDALKEEYEKKLKLFQKREEEYISKYRELKTRDIETQEKIDLLRQTERRIDEKTAKLTELEVRVDTKLNKENKNV